jgi:hypothetical protein
MSALAERQSVMNSRPIPASRRAATRLCPAARSARVAPCSASGVHSRVGTPLLTIVKSRSRTECSSSAILLGVAPSGFAGCGRRQHRLRIPENAPQKTTQFHRLTQRRALARRTPHTGIDLLDTDPYPVRPCCLELGRFQPKNNPQTTWTTTDCQIRDMSQWVHNEKDLNMSKCFPLFRR